jgi:L-iditol 2-dehydrogenase
MDRCKAAVFVGANKPLELQEFPIPEIDPNTGLVQMQMAAVCGSDVHAWHNPSTAFPRIFGHENIATIAELGDEIQTDALGSPLREGDRVLFRPRPCGRCYNCSMGERCHVVRMFGQQAFTEPPYIRGGFSQYVYLGEYPWLLRIPDEMSSERALFCVIGNHTVMNGLERIGGLNAGDTVVVQGTGPIGMGAILLSSVLGAKRIIAIGAPENRLRMAEEMGADETISIGEFREPEARVERVLELTRGHGADMVIECSGADSAVEEGLKMVRYAGKYLVIGQAEDHGPQPINPSLITQKSLLVSGVTGPTTRHIIRAMEVLNAHPEIPVEKLITHRFPLEKVNEAFETHESLEAMVAIVTPNA